MFRTNSILTRIALILILFAMVPMVFLVVSVLHNRNTTLQTSAVTRAQHESEQFAESIASLKRDIQNIADVFGMDQTLINSSKLLRRGATIGEEIDAYQNLREIISLIKTNEEIEEIRIYLPDSALVTKQKVNLFGMSELDESLFPQNMKSAKANCGWTLNDGSLFYYYHIVYSRLSDAFFTIEVSPDRFNQFLEATGLSGHFRLYDEYGVLLWESGEPGGDFTQSLDVNGWRLDLSMPLQQFGQTQTHSITIWLSMLTVMLPMIPILAYLASRSISRTIKQLAHANEAMTNREYRLIDEDSSIHELQMLQKSHNIMVTSIQEMIRDVYEAQHDRDQAELNSLFEQVKPHFLYNTLESGKWLALSEGARQTATFLETLSVFYRTGLGKGSVFIPLRQELLHISEYVNLMKMRYSDSIDLRMEVNCDVDRILVLRLILQPLVENAIEHGLHGEGHSGLVELCISSDGTYIDIMVADNGAGVTQEACDLINLSNGGGYGLNNIRQRLHIYYGNDASLRLSPRPEGGTCAHIRILHKEIQPGETPNAMQ